MSSQLDVGAVYRDARSRTASAALIRHALCTQLALNVDYLARAVVSLCHVIERQQVQIRALEEQCATVRSDLRRATRAGRPVNCPPRTR